MTSKPSESGDHDLVRRAQSGDDRALSRLLMRYEPELRRRIHGRISPAIRRKCADSDILQETLIVAAKQIDQFEYRGSGSFKAWLQAIAENATRRAVEHHAGTQKRDVRAEVSRAGRPETQHQPDRPRSPSRRAMRDELRRRVAQALGEMPEDYATVIQLLQHRRMTILEAAELMGRSVNAVKKLHARALADLAVRLGVAGRRNDA